MSIKTRLNRRRKIVWPDIEEARCPSLKLCGAPYWAQFGYVVWVNV